jgi:hypothetical protein
LQKQLQSAWPVALVVENLVEAAPAYGKVAAKVALADLHFSSALGANHLAVLNLKTASNAIALLVLNV